MRINVSATEPSSSRSNAELSCVPTTNRSAFMSLQERKISAVGSPTGTPCATSGLRQGWKRRSQLRFGTRDVVINSASDFDRVTVLKHVAKSANQLVYRFLCRAEIGTDFSDCFSSEADDVQTTSVATCTGGDERFEPHTTC